MDSYSIGLSGLDTAQKAFEIIGNNIANAATDGYHCQRINLAPAYSSQIGDVLLGGGVDVASITRMIDNILEQEILQQQSSLGQVSQELDMLHTVENAFGELSAKSSLSTALEEFFNSLQDLSAHPTEAIWQNQAVTAAETLADYFRTLGRFLNTLEIQIKSEAENTIDQINDLANQIAELNGKIQSRERVGGQANNLRDQRDQRIVELSELIGLETQAGEHGMVNVNVAGLPIVSGTSALELEVGLTENGSLGISLAGEYHYSTNVQGGRLGGLLSLKNELISNAHNELDSLASAIIQQINQYHVQAVGSEGSFTQLTGWTMTSENLADFEPAVTDGKIYIRVINTSTGEITREEITIDADEGGDTLTTIATAISAITGLTASVSSSKLSISADTNYEFDFLPGVSSADTSSMTSPPTISVSGIYTGSINQTYTGKVITGGTVGDTSGLQIQVKDGTGQVVATVNVGSGYAAGDPIEIADGIVISVGAGTLVVDEEFTIEALANSDTSGVLAAVGINTFFYGNSAADIAVCSEIADSPGRIATALGADMSDNTNALRMAEVRNQTLSGLNSLTPSEFYRRLVTDLGQQVYIKQIRQDNMQAMVQNLTSQQSERSGVNINDEAARMLVFEQMFTAMAKYLSTVKTSIFSLMEVI